jgi:hypothetical protein
MSPEPEMKISSPDEDKEEEEFDARVEATFRIWLTSLILGEFLPPAPPSFHSDHALTRTLLDSQEEGHRQ